jgi:hypothetical protein
MATSGPRLSSTRLHAEAGRQQMLILVRATPLCGAQAAYGPQCIRSLITAGRRD